MRKKKANDEKEVGMTNAVIFCRKSEDTIQRATKNGKLPCTYDDAGRRRFKMSDLRKYKAQLRQPS